MDIDSLKQWIGKTEAREDSITLAPLTALAATLDRTEAPAATGDVVMPCGHWLYFLPIVPLGAVGPDGHPQRGGFMPPVPLPRRMWAASRIDFQRPLMAGSAVTRTSRIADVSAKQGRTGTLVFVRIHHAIGDRLGVALTEDQDIVYRDMPRPDEASPTAPVARTDEQFSRRVVPDPVLLFRYSALTFNGHRIHYDRTYALDVERYPALVVHGPLIATLLVDQLRRQCPEAQIRSFEFKAASPLFDNAHFELCGRIDGDIASLWARGPQGQLAMQASARIAIPGTRSNP